MIVKLNNGTEYLVKWHHRIPRHQKLNREADAGGTSIFIQKLDGDKREDVCEVHLTRYYKDPYSKELGRKYSLTRALKDCKFPRSDRKAFWDAYFARLEEESVYNVGE